MQMDPESFADGFAELAGLVSGHLNGSQGFLQEPVLPSTGIPAALETRWEGQATSVCLQFFF